MKFTPQITAVLLYLIATSFGVSACSQTATEGVSPSDNTSVMHINNDDQTYCLSHIDQYSQSAKQGAASAQYNLGILYDTGRCVRQSHIIAFQLFQQSAVQGYAPAQFQLGIMYDFGKGVQQDIIKAMDWYQKAADHGIAGAQNNLGFIYAKGKGVPQDYILAMKWYMLAVDNGFVPAMQNMQSIKQLVTPSQISDSRKLADEWYMSNEAHIIHQ
ncbi:tetratricopeptide repeat protein [Sulfuriferula nivalis]|uniref:Sel1 repeat family protein n=1 Tax=Sulfuriferula nivalis TaxID=2675298 RepID=A0A809SBF0_9PROT|nr:tetratricopeptide repeat protein [Sulfuriferula nivalis]BBP02252.1 hypothetical protein SFSGTM_29600 [Sulfuriferula nivalis]